MAKRKLDALGNVKSHSGFANDPARLKKLQGQLDLAASVAEIKRQDAAAAAALKSTATAELALKAPAAVQRLKEKQGDVGALTMAEMGAIAFINFNGHVLKGPKQVHIDGLQKLIAAQPSVLNLAAPAAPLLALTMAPAPAAAAPAAAAPAAPAPAPAAPAKLAPALTLAVPPSLALNRSRRGV
jgi:hypothetical protein